LLFDAVKEAYSNTIKQKTFHQDGDYKQTANSLSDKIDFDPANRKKNVVGPPTSEADSTNHTNLFLKQALHIWVRTHDYRNSFFGLACRESLSDKG
jgi:hypothetical protein